MKLIVEYVADAVKFEHLAAVEKDPKLRAALTKQAAAYRKLAEERAKKSGVPPPENHTENIDGGGQDIGCSDVRSKYP